MPEQRAQDTKQPAFELLTAEYQTVASLSLGSVSSFIRSLKQTRIQVKETKTFFCQLDITTINHTLLIEFSCASLVVLNQGDFVPICQRFSYASLPLNQGYYAPIYQRLP